MPHSRLCYIFLLVLGRLHLVAGYVSISGCSGESATLHRGISFNSGNIVFYIHKNGVNNTLLAMLSKENSDPVKVSYEHGYYKKVSLDNDNILIHNLSKSDEGKYVIQPAFGTWSMKIEVNLVVLVAPPKQCTPNIKHVDNTLVASLDNEDCGNPAAHVSWYKLWANNMSRPVGELNNTWELKGNTMSKIVVGKEEDTYCACTESSAMHCHGTYDRFDLCSCFKIEKNHINATLAEQPNTTTRSESSDLKKTCTDIHVELLQLHTIIQIILVLLIIVILVFVAAVITSIIFYRKVSSPSVNPELSADEKTSNATTQSSEVLSPSGNPELSEKKETSNTTTNDSKVSSPSGNPELSEKKKTSNTTTNDSKEMCDENEQLLSSSTVSLEYISGTNSVKSSKSYIEIPRPTHTSAVKFSCVSEAPTYSN